MSSVTIANPTHPAQVEWELLKKQCQAFCMSNLLPKHIYDGCKTKEEVLAKAITVAWKGRELGIPPLYALSSIVVINGKPSLSSELMLALVLKKYPTANPEFEVTDSKATVCLTRPGGAPQTFSFSMDDAKRAGLVRSGTPWEKYPRDMLKARAVAAACRSLFPDALMGAIYTPEELGAHPIDVEEVTEGEVKETQEKPKESKIEASEPVITSTKGSGEVQAKDSFDNVVVGNTVGYDQRHAAKMAEPSTEPQRKKLYAMTRAAKISDGDVKAIMKDLFHVESSTQLSKAQIQELFLVLERDYIGGVE